MADDIIVRDRAGLVFEGKGCGTRVEVGGKVGSGLHAVLKIHDLVLGMHPADLLPGAAAVGR
jgi:hypothetical protein